MSCIIFVSHEATLTGAPILLLNIITWIRKNTDYRILLVLARSGPLREEFAKVATVVEYYEVPKIPFLTKVLRKLGLLKAYYSYNFKRLIKDEDINLVFVNTIVNGNLVDNILDNLNKVDVVTYVHELEYTINLQTLQSSDIKKVLSHTSFFLAGSDAVRDQLLGMGVQAPKIEVAQSSIPVVEFLKKSDSLSQSEIKQRMGIPSTTPLVVSVGTAGWRKGSDWFLQLAAKLKQAAHPVALVWVGATPKTLEYLQMEYEIRRYGLQEMVWLIPSTKDYFDYIYASDLFILTSREDPFPLVVLEAALVGKAVVCFDKSGGTPEFIAKQNGIVVPYGDVEAMAKVVQNLLVNPELRQQLGSNACETVKKYHDTPVVASKVLSVLKKYIR